MSEFELENKSEMIYINEETVNKLKEFPSIETKNIVTGEWNTAMVTVEANNKNEELENTQPENTCVVKQDPVTGEWNVKIVKVEENYDDDDIQAIEPENDDESESSDESESNDESESRDETDESSDEIDETDETDDIFEQCKTLCSDWLIHNKICISNREHNELDDNLLSRTEVSHNKFVTRSHLSNMMFSHIFMIMPCIWWMRIDRPDTDNDVFYSKLMSIIMTATIGCSYLYHYYDECILCNTETTYMTIATVCLNIYMYLQNVSVFYILPGGGILYALNKSLDYCNTKNKDFYELYHPFCHYIGGLYIYYCVWNLEYAQTKLCDTTNNDVIFNDVYSGMNYHTHNR